MNILVLTPASEFTVIQNQTLNALGSVTFTDSRREYSDSELITLVKDINILAVDPDNLGGFTNAKDKITTLINNAPHLRAIALNTTAYGYLDLVLCKRRNIKVTNNPGFCTNTIAELSITYLLGAIKQVFRTDRETQLDKYQLHQGREVFGKTIGIIGLGAIGIRTAELARALGMTTLGWNRTPKNVDGVESCSIKELLNKSDFISLHLADHDDTRHFISAELLAYCQKNVTIINASDPALVDEKAMAQFLVNNPSSNYVCETENLKDTPLASCANAQLFLGFGWYTEEASARNRENWVKNIVALVNGNKTNTVNIP